jgi:GAF domain-containing protein
MAALPRTDDQEHERARIVDQLAPADLRDDPTLTKIAQCVETIYGVPMAHVSLLDRDSQCVIGQVGLDRWKIDRQQTFCTRVVARNKVLVVEDATDHPEFKDNPLVVGEPYIRFYVGVPIVVEGVAVGTLCAMDDVPHEPDMRRRAEMFGLVHLLERALALRLDYGADSSQFALARDLVDARAYTTLTRYEGMGDPDHSELCQAEHKIRAGLDRLVQLGPDAPAPDGLDGPTDIDPPGADHASDG